MNRELFDKMVDKELNNRTIGNTIIDELLDIVPDVIVINTRPIKDLIRGTYDPVRSEKIFHTFYDDNRIMRPTVLQVVEILSDKEMKGRRY